MEIFNDKRNYVENNFIKVIQFFKNMFHTILKEKYYDRVMEYMFLVYRWKLLLVLLSFV